MATSPIHRKRLLNPLLPLPPSNPYTLQLPSPTELPELQGHYYHPRRQHTSQVPSFPGPLNVCPTCRIQLTNEWQRDVHFMERHLLGVKEGFVDAEEMMGGLEGFNGRNKGNYDGVMGKGRHVVEPWRFCEEPGEYADEVGDVIPGKQYHPPSDTLFIRNSARYCDTNKLPPKAKARFALMVQRAAVARQSRDAARKAKIQQEAGSEKVLGAQARVVKRAWVGGERGRGRSVA